MNQYVPANLSSPLVGLRLQVQADFFGPGSTARVSLAFSALPAMPGASQLKPLLSTTLLQDRNRSATLHTLRWWRRMRSDEHCMVEEFRFPLVA